MLSQHRPGCRRGGTEEARRMRVNVVNVVRRFQSESLFTTVLT
jgi:hypothetical protein